MSIAELSLKDSVGVDRTKAVFHKPELDIVRFVAFLMVFVCHALSYDPGSSNRLIAIGSRGVDLFFALSAYLITEILLREKRKTGSISLRNFYARRILRIWPLYFLYVLFSFLVWPKVNHGWAGFLPFAVFVANWQPIFTGLKTGVLWSISVEEQFYLCWPLLVRARRWHVAACVGLLLSAIAYRFALLRFGPHYFAGHIMSMMERSTVARMDAIAAGALLAFILQGSEPQLSRQLAWFALAIGCLAVTIKGSERSSVFITTVVAAGCIAILMAVMSLQPRNPAAEYLGRISYGLYIWHPLALFLAARLVVLRSPGEFALFSLVWLGIAISFADASYRWIESPFLKLKDRFAVVSRADLT